MRSERLSWSRCARGPASSTRSSPGSPTRCTATRSRAPSSGCASSSSRRASLEEYGVEVEALLAEYGPDQPAPPSAQEMAEYEQARDRGEQVSAPQPGPFHRPTQEKRAARAERDLALLGK